MRWNVRLRLGKFEKLAYNSFVSEKIDDYNSSFYYEYSGNILISFLTGRIE